MREKGMSRRAFLAGSVGAGLAWTAAPRPHPGILRPKGFIGFLGHGAHLEFRDIRIKEP